jgi:molybdopterin/thiamine biosynthesis adenylyltransferase
LDVQGVKKIHSSKVLIIGAGGLGCPAAQYLAASGINTLRWVDSDIIDASNLPRQVLFNPENVGKKKVLVGRDYLKKLSPDLIVYPEPVEAQAKNLPDWISAADIVLECSDQFQTKQLVNKLCVQINRPLIIGSAIQWNGQLQVIDPKLTKEACYACTFDPKEIVNDAACGAYGVFGPAVGTIGVLQANEALKIAAGFEANVGKLLLFDAIKLDFDTIMIKKRTDCSVCAKKSNSKQA